MSNLENLRKQAKQYLRWHRERHYPVAAAIRAGLPRMSHLSDAQILDGTFKLADAQELVARQMGFVGWQALKIGAKGMNGKMKSGATRPVLNSVAAQLFVRDVQASCEFFTSKMGFVVDFVYGEPAFYGQVSRDNVRFVLRHMDEPVFTEAREREHLLSAAVTVEIKRLFRDYQEAGVHFQQTLKKQPWGARNFVVADPDGNYILFAGPAE
jgi:catechol 2,3-dioxygenase-like lactoylglutathione lyase family enzyme